MADPEWLMGVYKGDLITVNKGEAKKFWNAKIRDNILTEISVSRIQIRPWFYVLEPEKDAEILPLNSTRDRELLKKYGLELAYRDSGLEPIKAFGYANNKGFLLDKSAMESAVIGLKRLLKPDKSLPPQKNLRIALQKILQEKGLSADNRKDMCAALMEILQGRTCILALCYKDGVIRTGTFFKIKVDDDNILFEPCVRNAKLIGQDIKHPIGKGVLLGIDEDTHWGAMQEERAILEMDCPASKLCVKFRDELYKEKEFCIVYRELPTDLRADMPLAFLKISKKDGDGAFEEMFEGLGISISKQIRQNMLVTVEERNLHLDGTIVDYDGIKRGVTITDDENKSRLHTIEDSVISRMFFISLIHAAREDALSALAKDGWDLQKTKKVARKNMDKIAKKYDILYEHFKKGLANEKLSAGLGRVNGGLLEYLRNKLDMMPPKWYIEKHQKPN